MAKKDEESPKSKGEGSSKSKGKEGDKAKRKKSSSSKGKDDKGKDNKLKAVLKGQGPAPIYITIFLTLIKVWLFIYDCLNYIPYAIFNSPAEKLRKSGRQKAEPTTVGDNGSPWRNVENTDGKLLTEVSTASSSLRYVAVSVVTVYATLGEEAIAHSINETEATTIVTTAELIPKVQKMVDKVASLKRAIYFLPTNPEADDPDLGHLRDRCEHVLSLEELEERGEDNPSDDAQPKTTELALIMYTSGTTGMPKGVMLTHANVVAAVAGQGAGVNIINEDDTFIGYLPLAHILEVDAELTVLSHGCRIGYSSPLTLHDRASKVKRGTHGDCHALQPTLLAAVPAVMDRIFKAVSEEVAASPRIMQEFFRLNYERKRSRLEDGYDSPFLDRIVFKRIRALLGGKVRGVLSGGAPLSGETQRFMNICFCCPVIQGYGLTETCGAAAIASMDDLSTGTVGPPVRCSDIMLREWKEAGYSPENDPPTGEVLIGGPNVAAGYYKNKKKTDEDFITVKGRRWFATGDIGEFRPDGSLSVIDRKKDLVKLQNGEYVSLARIESVLLTSSLVDNICLHGNSMHDYLVGLVVPNEKNVKKLAEQLNVDTSDWEEVCENEEVNKNVLKELTNHATKNSLNKSEVPGKIYLCSEAWTADEGLLTEALKLKRRPIEQKYKKELEKILQGGIDLGEKATLRPAAAAAEPAAASRPSSASHRAARASALRRSVRTIAPRIFWCNASVGRHGVQRYLAQYFRRESTGRRFGAVDYPPPRITPPPTLSPVVVVVVVVAVVVVAFSRDMPFRAP
uniref:long-chain-fatty-acid--CoA ligase n=1 Tax=Plectus sambesii TaxID=2011161 RepID=A0A914WWP9_9BILA